MKCSFWSLLNAYKIEIPMIQRDYAHGRDSEQARDTRETLVRKVIKAALGTGPHVYLQYVFGNVNDENTFIPIDGQQRLTTLYLLHLYLINKVSCRLIGSSESCHVWCEQLQQTRLSGAKNILSRFCYKTRATSNDFCWAIVLHGCLPPTDAPETISQWIADQSWFAPAWRRDPTVVGMMRTLDTIDAIFKEESNTISGCPAKEALLRLTLSDKNDFVVDFQWFDMHEHDLTDELYLKMNARGLPLTPLENLKSAIEKFYQPYQESIEPLCIDELNCDWDDSSKRFKPRQFQLSSAKAFSRMMDCAWLDAVWRCEKGQKDVVSSADGSLLILLMRFCVFSAAVHDRIVSVSGEENEILKSCRQDINKLLEKQNRDENLVNAQKEKIRQIELRMDIKNRIIPIRGTERFIPFSILKRVLMDNRDAVLGDVSKWFNRFVQYSDLMRDAFVPYWEDESKIEDPMTWHSFLGKFECSGKLCTGILDALPPECL